VSADASPLAVAAAINGLDATKVEHFKAAARRAAGELCWEHERAILRASLEPVLQDAPAAENTNAFSPG
jgi:hypothetical protein